MRVPTLNSFHNQYSLMQTQFDYLAHLLAQASKEKILVNPSDDVVLSNQINFLEDNKSNIETFSQNNVMALSRTNMLENSAKSMVNVADRIKQLLIEANNDLKTDEDRKKIAQELGGLRDELLKISSRQDGSNNFLFSGSNTGQIPYIFQNGEYVYCGSQDNGKINIGPCVDAVYNQSGYKIFDHFLSGNGNFTTTATATNTGSATTSAGCVTNQSAYVSDTYTITFVTNSAGNLAYQVTGTNSGQVIPPPPATIPGDAPNYIPDGTITFNGNSLSISGAPNAGDTFQVQPSTPDNVFDSINDVINNLNSPIGQDAAKRAQFHQSLTQSTAVFSDVFNRFVGFQSEIGLRTQMITNQGVSNKAMHDQYEITIEALSDVDLVKIETEIKRQKMFMEVTQSAYMQIESILSDLIKITV